MSFDLALIAALGTAADAFDIKVSVRRCFFYDFLGVPVRLWDGEGKAYAGGEEWLGTMTEDGGNAHSAPAVRDSRDGASPEYNFSLPYIDEMTFRNMKADRALVSGRFLTCYHAIFLTGEGLRPGTPLRFAYRLSMMETRFSETFEGSPGNSKRNFKASVLCRTQEFGRSRIPNGTYTDTAQHERARILGVASDSGCVFVAGNARRTYVVGG